jgi:hypothetical protein
MFAGFFVRDDFTSPIKTKIAKRAGYLCSNPHCRRLTVGAARGHDGSQNIGVIAHITAASPGGARYDPNLTLDQRSGADNGLLLCQVHAHLVDHDEKTFTVEILRKWKLDAERYSSESLLGLGIPGGAGLPDTVAIEIQLGVTGGATVDAIAAKVVTASRTDINSFKHMPGWPQHPVELTLRLKDGNNSRPFQVSGLAAAVEAFNEFTVIAPPGTGKTTTMLQAADAIHAVGRMAALFIPLGEWAAQDQRFLPSVLSRPAYMGVSESDLHSLAENGRLVLVLDGWNELDGEARKRATAGLRMLQRSFPRLCVIISTRRQALDLPIGGQQVEIDLLSDDQQLAIARAYRGDEGVKLMDSAWREPGLRELVTIPLYLTALLTSVIGAALPTTKEEVLRLFANQHDGPPEKAEALQETLFGFHPRMLTALAVEATSTANTAISDKHARAVVKDIEDQLIAEGQITVAPQPASVLDVLVSRHALVRSGGGALSFQHQQFQEWYASFNVEDVMQLAASGDAAATERLRVAFLDQRAWEESVLFACERLSRAGAEGAHAVAAAILSALSIDPLLAAEMIYRSSEAVWKDVAEPVIAFVKRWHEPHKSKPVDRAVGFMIATGRWEFADTVWPMVESTESQVYLSVMRAARWFRPSVLGFDAAKRLAAIPDASRGHILGELASRSGIEGMELATNIAKVDPNVDVQFEVIQSLFFRRGDRHALEILKTAPDAVWANLARRGYSEEIIEPTAAARLQVEREKLRNATTDPVAILGLINDEAPSPEVEKAVEDTVASPQFPARDQHADGRLYETSERHPEAVARGLVRRMEAGLELPFSSDEYLAAYPPSDNAPIATLVLDEKTPKATGIAAANVAGPKSAQALMQKLADAAVRLNAAPRNSRMALSEELRLWEDRLSVTPVNSFLSALIVRGTGDAPEVIGAIADVIGRHGGRDHENSPLVLGNATDAVVAILRSWAQTLIGNPGSDRAQMWNVAIAIGRIARPELLNVLKQLLDEDLRRRSEARQQTRAAGGHASIELRSEAAMSYSLQYREAFAKMGEPAASFLIGYLEDGAFGFDAACALKSIFGREHGAEKPSMFRRWPHLADAAMRRAQGPLEGDTAYSDAIFEVVERLIAPGCTPEQQALAIRITRIALAMPHRGKEELIDRVMALPRPVSSKRELVASLVMAGQKFKADLALEAVADWVEEAKKNTWRFRDSIYEVSDWLELLPFSDRPASLLVGVQAVADALPSHQQMERVVTAAGAAPDFSDGQLADFLRRFRWLASEHEWANAFLSRKTESSALMLIQLVNEGLLASGRNSVNQRWLSQHLAPLAEKYLPLKMEIFTLFDGQAGPSQQLLERTIQEIGGADSVMTLLRGYARAGKPFDGSLYWALKHTAVERHRIGESNSYNLHPVSIAPLRRELFALMHGNDPQIAALARECLISIDDIRDQYGAAESEPRHPDVASGKSWPREAKVDERPVRPPEAFTPP